jgi:hypothetical protein
MIDTQIKVKPVIINAKPAENHLEMIKSSYNDIISNIASHSLKVENFNNQKEIERQNNLIKQSEMAKQDQADKLATEKDQRANALKEKELEIKKMALST